MQKTVKSGTKQTTKDHPDKPCYPGDKDEYWWIESDGILYHQHNNMWACVIKMAEAFPQCFCGAKPPQNTYGYWRLVNLRKKK